VVSVGRAKILLVDDEPALLQLLQRYLQRVGFDVETQSSSVQALAEFEAASGRYDLVIADLGLPGMPGDTMVMRMLDIQPKLLVLICSGSLFPTSSLPKALERQVGFLQKPFLPKMMLEAIERLLANSDGGA